jgi:tRNA/tmRNA/rRNA uracil-C5-methylase (TrmA/RlmC/RlmD family)
LRRISPLDIENLNSDSDGVARLDKMTVFVPGTIRATRSMLFSKQEKANTRSHA